MAPEPINAAKLALQAMRALDEGRRTVAARWHSLTDPGERAKRPPADRREPPKIW